MKTLISTLALSIALSSSALACSESQAERAAKAVYAEETSERNGQIERIEQNDNGSLWYAAVTHEKAADMRFVFSLNKACNRVVFVKKLSEGEDAWQE